MVKYINYKDKEYPISISFYALEKLESEGLDLNDENQYKPILRLFWHSLVAGHFHEEKELTLKEENVNFILDECLGEFKELMPLFLDAITGKNSK